MTTLSDAEQRFLRSRRWRSSAWIWVGSILVLAWCGLLVWLWTQRPTLVDPRVAWNGLADGSLPLPTLHLLAAMTPVLVCTLFAVVLAMLLLAFGYNLQERRVLKLVARLENEAS